MKARSRLAAGLAVATLIALSAACGGSGGDAGGPEGPVMVTITEQNGDVSASSDLVKANTGQRIMLLVTSDVTDEIHVHSVPDHEFEVEPGREQTFSFAVDTPGTIEVESHVLDIVILKLEIS